MEIPKEVECFVEETETREETAGDTEFERRERHSS
jgi:hypothetical protein